ncbi:hypothetical protein GCM10017673_38390 [Streptosporangium violaceochromogenes]|nr:hypothetical protein GCM10017673_38390 [Streptosporangium violaceochromogenes]
MSVYDAARGPAMSPQSPRPVFLPGVDGLSARSYGVYCYMLAASADWFTVSSLMAVFSDRRDGLNTTMAELIDAGLVVAAEWRDGNLVRRGYRVAS